MYVYAKTMCMYISLYQERLDSHEIHVCIQYVYNIHIYNMYVYAKTMCIYISLYYQRLDSP